MDVATFDRASQGSEREGGSIYTGCIFIRSKNLSRLYKENIFLALSVLP